MSNIITVSREFGSGGRELGKRLADELGVAYFDKEILEAIAEQTTTSEWYAQAVLERYFTGGLADGAFRYYLGSYGLSLLAACVASTPLMAGLWRRLPQRAERVLLPVVILAGLLLCTAYLVDATYNPFLYFRF